MNPKKLSIGLYLLKGQYCGHRVREAAGRSQPEPAETTMKRLAREAVRELRSEQQGRNLDIVID